MEEQRLDFSDYSAEEQKNDVEKYKKRIQPKPHAYLMRVDGEWGHFIIKKQGEDIKFYGSKNLTEVFFEMKETRPEYKPWVIQNQGLENYLRDVKAQREKRYGKQLSIDFTR